MTGCEMAEMFALAGTDVSGRMTITAAMTVLADVNDEDIRRQFGEYVAEEVKEWNRSNNNG